MTLTNRTTKKPRREWRSRFLANFAKFGNVTTAAHAAGKSRTYCYEIRREDEAFAKAWDEAQEMAVDGLERVAQQRAVKSSDVLLIFLLKAHRPAMYRENLRLEHTGPNGGAPTMNLTVKRERDGTNQP